MTIEEKRRAIENHCDGRLCSECVLYGHVPAGKNCYSDPADIEGNYAILFPNAEPTTPDAVEHPDHYNREGAMECIKEMVLIFGVEETMSFCKLNAWKYRYRAADKGGLEDLKKSDNYLRMYEKLKGGECL
jgi:hypothetical protein